MSYCYTNPIPGYSDSNSDDDKINEVAALVAAEIYAKAMEPRRGSVYRRIMIDREFAEGHNRLFKDYFAENPVYPPLYFGRRFRMRRELFCRIQNAVEAHDPYFVYRPNKAGNWGVTSLQKVTSATRMLSTGGAADSSDKYLRIGENTAIKTFKRFVKTVVALYSEQYLRSPNEDDIARLLAVGERRSFLGMLGSIDWMDWKWKNCPSSWKGMYTGYHGKPIIILEAIASYDLWIWQAFFDLPGSLNDINVLERSSVFTESAIGRAPNVNYIVNDHQYTMGYYLADGIYPPWASFVKTILAPQDNKRKHFAACQESVTKDVERAFGVLQSRFAVIRQLARFWKVKTLDRVMKCVSFYII